MNNENRHSAEKPLREPDPLWPGAPRLCPQRPFPPYRYVRGLNPHPERHPEGHSRGEAENPPRIPPERWYENEPYLYGIDLYHYGFLWESHEAWEGLWRQAPRASLEKSFLQGLILNSAAQIKAHAGTLRGVQSRARLARRRLSAVYEGGHDGPEHRFMGIDIAGLLNQIDRHYGPAWNASGDLVIRLDGPAPRLIPKRD